MAWQEPKTDWSAADHFTYADLNRINGNVNYLVGSAILPVDYTQNSFLTLSAWKTLTAQIAQMTAAANLSPVLIDTQVTADNVRKIELAIAEVKVYFELAAKNKEYPLYTNQVYAGGHYVRG
uniref:Uncharacterized protein n=1 Tax=Siphoviridae sp. ctDsE1 TaxID=2825390 RepID=A0A8S5TYJ1_9CAUD|nr:MAG TPA: hypothetical protein [Siphoviridae sp. ctDsE1]